MLTLLKLHLRVRDDVLDQKRGMEVLKLITFDMICNILGIYHGTALQYIFFLLGTSLFYTVDIRLW